MQLRYHANNDHRFEIDTLMIEPNWNFQKVTPDDANLEIASSYWRKKIGW